MRGGSLPRFAPSIEIGPAPGNGAWTQVHRAREVACRNQAIDGRTAQAGRRYHRRQRANRRVCSTVRAGEGTVRFMGQFITARSILDRLAWRSTDDFRLRVIGVTRSRPQTQTALKCMDLVSVMQMTVDREAMRPPAVK